MAVETPSSGSLRLTRASVEAAHALIRPHIHTTPILTNTTLNNIASTPQTPEALKSTKWEGQDPARPKVRLFFKGEHLQRIGAFKVRGAFHAVLRLIEERGLEDVRKQGLTTQSSGTWSLPRYTPRTIAESDFQEIMLRPSPLSPRSSTSPRTLSCPPSLRPQR
jgi:threonine dehydratase